MLGRLHLTVDECISSYSKMMGEIFSKTSLLPFKVYNGRISSRYATSVLDRNIKDVIEFSQHAREEAMLETNPRCKV